MVKYTLLHKPTLSGWPSVPRQIKTIIIGGILVTIIFLILVQSSRNAKLRNLYATKLSTAEILDLEIEYMPAVSESDTRDSWKEASVKDGMIYSAYLDSRPEVILEDRHHDERGEKTWAVIRIVAILPLGMNDKPLTCYFKYRDNESGESNFRNKTASRVRAIKENWGLDYSAFFVNCDLTLPINMDYVDYYYDRHLPMKVALGSTNRENLTRLQFVNVHYPQTGVTQTNSVEDDFLAVCGPVFHHEYDRALHLVEYVEYYSMLGVNHFTFYNESVSTEVAKVLSYYADNNLATILEWKLPAIYKFELTLRLGGFYAAINDCLYRSSYYQNYKYVLVSDVDEFIVPKIHKDFKELINFLDPPSHAGYRNDHASFKFKNVFFYLMYEDDKTDRDPDVPYLYLQAKTERVERPDDPEGTGKYVARSQDVVELGSHNVWMNRPGSSVFSDRFDERVVGEDVALSHHYRYCEAETAGCYFKSTIIDRSAHKYIKDLGQRVAKVCTAIFGDSGCPAPTD